ncbi:MAG: hypothetical protein ACOCRK_11225 [bacterium]
MIDKHGKCPECGEDWDGGDIPKKSRKHYSPPYKWSKLIGVEIPEKYDGVSYWMCPKCKTTRDRWTGEKNDRKKV